MFSDPITRSLEWSRKGYMGMAILLMINERSMTGYEIMRVMHKITQGSWKPTPGGVYPVLKKLESQGLMKGEWLSYKGRKKKVYAITDDGKRALERIILKQSEIAFGINRLFENFLRNFFGLEHPFVAPPSLLKMLLPDEEMGELDELQERREMIREIMRCLQQLLEETETRIQELKKTRSNE
ncbi:MAG: PadR family transcriptional regulator [Candidatus Methanomethylicaceae archaeon]